MGRMPGAQIGSRFQHRFVDTGEVRLHVAEVRGEQAMVMLHGIGMDWRVWQAISRRLSPRFHLYLVDLRGHGESDKPDHGYTVAHYAADIEELLVQLSLRDTVLVGSSLGGVVAAATELPLDMAARKILVDPPLTGGPVRDPNTFRTILRLKREDPGALSEYLLRSNPGTGRFLAGMMADMWREAPDAVIEDMLADDEEYFDVSSALAITEQPTLLLQADADRGGVLTDEDAARALRLLPHATLTRVPGSGHAIHATNPAEFATLVNDFATSSAQTPQLQ
jgi:pimeloyl-ACP methyl ester carboxylesterase